MARNGANSISAHEKKESTRGGKNVRLSACLYDVVYTSRMQSQTPSTGSGGEKGFDEEQIKEKKLLGSSMSYHGESSCRTSPNLSPGQSPRTVRALRQHAETA